MGSLSLSAQGLKLFSPEMHDAASYPHQVVMDFLERYFGKDLPAMRQTTLEHKMADDKVYFRNGSTIVVVPASENGRGHRSNVVVREECRQILKSVDDSILSPFQTMLQKSEMEYSLVAKIYLTLLFQTVLIKPMTVLDF